MRWPSCDVAVLNSDVDFGAHFSNGNRRVVWQIALLCLAPVPERSLTDVSALNCRVWVVVLSLSEFRCRQRVQAAHFRLVEHNSRNSSQVSLTQKIMHSFDSAFSNALCTSWRFLSSVSTFSSSSSFDSASFTIFVSLSNSLGSRFLVSSRRSFFSFTALS